MRLYTNTLEQEYAIPPRQKSNKHRYIDISLRKRQRRYCRHKLQQITQETKTTSTPNLSLPPPHLAVGAIEELLDPVGLDLSMTGLLPDVLQLTLHLAPLGRGRLHRGLQQPQSVLQGSPLRLVGRLRRQPRLQLLLQAVQLGLETVPLGMRALEGRGGEVRRGKMRSHWARWGVIVDGGRGGRLTRQSCGNTVSHEAII